MTWLLAERSVTGFAARPNGTNLAFRVFPGGAGTVATGTSGAALRRPDYRRPGVSAGLAGIRQFPLHDYVYAYSSIPGAKQALTCSTPPNNVYPPERGD